jgi:hypothetical protein
MLKLEVYKDGNVFPYVELVDGDKLLHQFYCWNVWEIKEWAAKNYGVEKTEIQVEYL